ncbi:hypothetical protein ACLOJK_011928 [Asimina triloba]
MDAIASTRVLVRGENSHTTTHALTGKAIERTFSGTGAGMDIVVSSVRAYVSALNKMLSFRIPAATSSFFPPIKPELFLEEKKDAGTQLTLSKDPNFSPRFPPHPLPSLTGCCEAWLLSKAAGPRPMCLEHVVSSLTQLTPLPALALLSLHYASLGLGNVAPDQIMMGPPAKPELGSYKIYYDLLPQDS